MKDTLTMLYELAGAAGYEARDRDTVLHHLALMAEALWPFGHLDQIAQACASHYDEGQAAALADYEAQEEQREADAEASAWDDSEREYLNDQAAMRDEYHESQAHGLIGGDSDLWGEC